ncbi:Tryptophan-specific transport protein [invertebrate metagenome]|uniref:Tryptophan-specific transport protein n=1 Tax=invertebrate metagenome TaxID=1711999 RepID=A0A2H9TCM6_9ZZZZ
MAEMGSHIDVLSEKPVRRRRTIAGGAFIVAGTAVGAGMFSMPVVTSGIWFSYSLLLLMIVGFCMYSASLYLLEVNLRFPRGAGFDTMVHHFFGRWGQVINGVSVAFVCYVLTYAYISGGSSIVTHSVSAINGANLSPEAGSLIFSVCLGAVVIAGTWFVDRVSTVLVGGMLITFASFVFGILDFSEPARLFPCITVSEALPYSLMTLPFMAVSFGIQNCIPSLTRYFDKDSRAVRKSVFCGTLLALLFYCVWQAGIFSNLSREQFPAVIKRGGNIGALLAALKANGLSSQIYYLLQLFSHMAVASSFLGVSLSLFDYISDLFGFSDNLAGRLKTGAVTFLPPTLLGMFLPDGFIKAIVFAGLGAVVFAILVPVLMAYMARQQEYSPGDFKVSGGSVRMFIVGLFGVVVFILSLLEILSLLPAFGH